MCYPAPITKRLKGQRRDRELLPFFVNQQGVSHDHLASPDDPANTIVSVDQCGEFQALEHGRMVTFRAFVVTLQSGLKVPAYSRDHDDYVMCQHLGYKAAR